MADVPDNTWRPRLQGRVLAMAAVFLAWTVAIETRLVYLQVFQHEELTARAERQQLRTVAAPARRGEILDRNGRVLAYSVDADTVYAVPNEIADAERAARALCGALADCRPRDVQALAERIRRGRYFAYVRRQITPEQARRIAALDLEGIGFMKESRRLYPNRELAAHLLGYVGIDSDGLAGIEERYDTLIKGRPGTVLIQTDARRRAFSSNQKPPTSGDTLELTVDVYLQHIVERELRAGVLAAGAAGGSAVVQDPHTGEVLALANHPTFNPNAYRDFSADERRNRAVQDLYEPGSTFKIVTASAALEEKIVGPADLVNTGPGHIRFGTRTIDEAGGRNYGELSFQDVIVKSSNVGVIRVGLRLGPERLSGYVRRFGFGRPTSPDFRGENPGIVWRPERLNDSALASVAMGYQVGVTPMQMAAATSAVANGGELVQPRVVRAVIRDGRRLPVPRRSLGRPISAATAAQLTSIMEAVVERGTGSRARVDGHTVAGKTGTASKVVGGRYSQTDYNVSFVGFVPSHRPALTIVVVVDSPRRLPAYGGVVAAPIFQRIADAALRHLGVPPTINAPPPLLVTRREAGRLPVMAPASMVVAGAAADEAFPDLTGLSARDAVRVLGRLGVTPRIDGTGVVIDQVPPPGVPVDGIVTARLRLGRPPVVPPADERP